MTAPNTTISFDDLTEEDKKILLALHGSSTAQTSISIPEAVQAEPVEFILDEPEAPPKEEIKVEAEVPQEAPVEEKPIPKLDNYSVKYSYSTPLKGEFQYTDSETSFMPSMTAAETKVKIDGLVEDEITTDKAGAEWAGVINAGIEFNTYSEGFVGTVMDPKAKFVQSVTSSMGELSAGPVKHRVKEGVKLTGEKARIHVRDRLKLGAIINIPLWHSGFWIRIKAPADGELLELYREITAEKVTLGRATYGLLFSNNTSYSSRALLDFCLQNKYDASINLPEDQDLRDHISTLDLPILFWGLACSIWPNGFQYMRSCVSDPEKCQHVIKETLNLSKLLFVNKEQLTSKQIMHMTKRDRGSMSMESVKNYLDEFAKGRPRISKLSEDVTVTLKVPSAREHIEAGHRWISSIEENYGKSLTLDEKRRDNYLITQGKASVMRQYAHFVSQVDVDGAPIDDQETIEGVLTDLTSSDEVRNKFLEEAAKYIDESCIALIAIPTFKCPSCGGEQVPAKSAHRHPELIPIDVSNVFFSLAVQRIRKIEAR